jgi:hypothetical protein
VAYGAQHMWDNHKVAAAEADEAAVTLMLFGLIQAHLADQPAVFE